MKKSLPRAPGVYIFKDAQDRVIYIGKAKSIKNRVSTYFNKSTSDWKVKSLIEEHADLDYILTKNETEALLLEAQLIGEHKPKYNVLLKSGQPFVYILFSKGSVPEVTVVRNKNEKGIYFGPFLHKSAARKACSFLLEKFRLNLCNKKIENGCLDYHLGRCAGSCKKEFDREDYLFRFELAQQTLKNNHRGFKQSLKERIAFHNERFEFEKSRHLNDYLQNIELIFHTIQTRFTETKFENEAFAATTPAKEISKDYEVAERELQQALGTDRPIKTIDCFDISHFQSSSLVGSCVRFTLGEPDKNNFRRFKIRTLTQQNDYAALQEIVARRYRDAINLPDLIVIDGGKGQLSAVKHLVEGSATVISLAKREETIFGSSFPEGIKLDVHTAMGKLLIALRDYTHHFAVSYHRVRRKKEFKDLI